MEIFAESIYQKIEKEKEKKDFDDWKSIRRYLKLDVLMDDEGDLDPHKIRQMMNYLNEKARGSSLYVKRGQEPIFEYYENRQKSFKFELVGVELNVNEKYTLP